jgi:hypothetical protein
MHVYGGMMVNTASAVRAAGPNNNAVGSWVAAVSEAQVPYRSTRQQQQHSAEADRSILRRLMRAAVD